MMNDDRRDENENTDILIVDDTPGNLHLLSRILIKRGYRVREANDGKTALEAAQTLLPDLILLDIMMPDMDGYSVCDRLKSERKTAEIPVIFLSALDDVFDKVKAFKAGGVDYITKPFQFQEVLARVQNQLTIRKAEKKLRLLNAELEARVKQRTRELEVANAKLREMAFRDDLTNLPNRALFLQQLDRAIRGTAGDRNGNPGQEADCQFVVLFLDCDRFKMVNESLGHSVGDELLVAISQRLQSLLKPGDTLARLGGDEFAILVTDIEGRHQAIAIAERVLDVFSYPFSLRHQEVFINASIGIALSHLGYEKPEHLLRDADTAMYRAKDLGKGQYHIFDPSMYHKVSQTLQIENDLRRAIQQEEFIVYYQPIISLKTGKIAGFEALVRWHHPQKGLISPGLFIPVAEETGLIAQIGNWVFRKACDRLRHWRRQKLVDESLFVSVNVSARQFAQLDLVEQIKEVLARTQLAPQCLKLEITESAIMDNPKTAAAILESLRQEHIQLSIDDFGTGYSSLSYLHSFQVDTLKIDQAFVQRMDETRGKFGLVPVIVNIAKTMGMGVIAEGVETEQQLASLRRFDCEFAQGYLFAKPLEERQLLQLIESRPTW